MIVQVTVRAEDSLAHTLACVKDAVGKAKMQIAAPRVDVGIYGPKHVSHSSGVLDALVYRVCTQDENIRTLWNRSPDMYL